MGPVILLTVGALAAGCAAPITDQGAPKPPLPVFSTPTPAPISTPRPSKAPKPKATSKPWPKPRPKPKPKPSPAAWLPATSVRTFADLPRVWQRIAMCESSGDLHQVTGSYYGLFQLRRGWYRSAGLVPERTTLAQQYQLALHVWHRQGWRAWECAGMLGIS